MTRKWIVAWVSVVGVLAACGYSSTHPPVTQEGKPFTAHDASIAGRAPDAAGMVDGTRIGRSAGEPQNWLTYYGGYHAQRYSGLDQINTSNVRTLRPAWIFQAGVVGLIANPATYAFEAAPIVVDGTMFVSGWDGYVWALDATNGRVLWRYRHAIPLDVPLCCGNVNRGVAVAQGKVFVATANGSLLALDAATGKPAWQQAFVDVRAGETATVAPLVVKDKVIAGSSGAEYGVRGHIDAFDIATGRPVWRRYAVPKPGEPGSDSWGNASAWQRGGGSAWITGSYDPELNLLYWGTGNPSPDFDGGLRPGSNLYTNAVLALDPDTGAIRWHHQWTPHDVWDYDGVNENILFELDGRRLLAHFDKNGFLYILDRQSGRMVRSTKFAPRVTWGDVDPATGRTTTKTIPTSAGVEICPGPAGAKEWPHAAYSRRTRLLYAPFIDACGTFTLKATLFREGMPYWGGDATVQPDQVAGGGVKAFDPATGREAWSWKSRHPIVASVLATAGDLLFVGEPTGEFDALDARTGELLWQFQTGSGIHSNPVSYSVGNRQYVAVPTGWGGWMKGFAPQLYGASRGSALVVFALP